MMIRSIRHVMLAQAMLVAGLGSMLGGCGNSGNAAVSPDRVGYYTQPPSQAQRPRVGVTTFALDGGASTQPISAQASQMLCDFAADEMGELLTRSGRFTIVARPEFAAMLDRQHLAGAIKPGQVTAVRSSSLAAIDGVEFVLVGSISTLEISKKAQDPGMVDQMKDFVTRAPERKDVVLSATCGIGFSLIDPATSDVVISNNSEFAVTANVKELGLEESEDATTLTTGEELPVSDDDRRKIISFAIDDAIRKSLPKIDRFLISRRAIPNPMTANPMTANPGAANPANPSSNPAAPNSGVPSSGSANPSNSGSAPSAAPIRAGAAQKTCSVCGAANDSTAKYCKKCGSKL